MKVDLLTMDAEVDEHKSTNPLDHIIWPTPRRCEITRTMYEKLMNGEDIEMWVILNYLNQPGLVHNHPSNVKRHEEKKQQARNLMYCLDRHAQRDAYRLAILASVLTRGRTWLSKDGDHCIATRIGQCLGRHFLPWDRDLKELFEWPSQ